MDAGRKNRTPVLEKRTLQLRAIAAARGLEFSCKCSCQTQLWCGEGLLIPAYVMDCITGEKSWPQLFVNGLQKELLPLLYRAIRISALCSRERCYLYKAVNKPDFCLKWGIICFCQDYLLGLPWWLRWLRVCLQFRRPRFDPWVWKIPWRRKWLPTPVFLPGKSQGQRSLEGYSLWGHKEWDMTWWLDNSKWLKKK